MGGEGPVRAAGPTPRSAGSWPRWVGVSLAALYTACAMTGAGSSIPETGTDATRGSQPLFGHSAVCVACHVGSTTPSGQNVSIGFDWRASMMANAARDPYWQAAVRREVLEHPRARTAIEDKCATCHMPMARYEEAASGGRGSVFEHLPVDGSPPPGAALALDGVSCSVCHQIAPDDLGEREAFSGGFTVAPHGDGGARTVFGPFEPAAGLSRVMASASGFEPVEGAHIQASELCASCHTLFTHALDSSGNEIAELPEQTPYLEWLESDFRDERSCQDCHMPVVDEDVPVSEVLGPPRQQVSRHAFRGGNFFVLRMLNRYRDELAVEALPHELEIAAARTVDHLQTDAARVGLLEPAVEDRTLRFDVEIENLAGHKLPTAYPSRRAWLHVTVADAAGRLIFESGRLRSDGSIVGNDGDEDPLRWERHHPRVVSPDQVQIFESVMEDRDGGPTTGLLRAVGYLKDNRILPRGFDKHTAHADVAVRGGALDDPAFEGGRARTGFEVAVEPGTGPFRVSATLLYQPIAFRWAMNLAAFDAPETRRFVRYYRAMAPASAVSLAANSIVVDALAP